MAAPSPPLISFEDAGFGVPSAELVSSVEETPEEQAEGGYVSPPEVARAYQRQAEREADRAAKSAEQEALERKQGKLATTAAKFAEGALDLVTAPGSLWAASHEAQGKVVKELTGWGGLEEFARDVGEASTGKEALAALGFGLSGADLDTYDKQKRDLDEQEKAWPMLSSVSKLAGQAALSMGVGGLAAAPAGIVRTALAAGAEGAAAGAQTAYAEGAPLRDVISSAVTGAALASFIGGGAAAVSKGASKSYELARDAFEGVDAEKFANERALKAFGPRSADVRKLRTEEKVQQLGRDARTYKLQDGTKLIDRFDSAEDLAPKIARAVEETGGELGALRQQVAEAGEAVDARAFLKRVDEEIIGPLRSSPSPQLQARGEKAAAEIAELRGRVQDLDDSIARRIPESELNRRVETAEMDVLRAREEGAREAFRNVEMTRSRLLDARERLGSVRDKVDREAAEGVLKEAESAFMKARDVASKPPAAVAEAEARLVEARRALENPIKPAAPITYSDLLKQQRALKAVAYPDKGPGQGITLTPEHATEVAQMERLLESTLEEHAESVLSKADPKLAGRYKDVRRMTESFIKLRKLNEKAIQMNLGNRAVSLTDYMTALTGANLAGGPSGIVGGLAVAGLHKMARERGSAFLANLYTEGLDSVVGDTVAPAISMVMSVAKPVARTAIASTKQEAARQYESGEHRKEAEPGRIAPLVHGATFASLKDYDDHVDALVRMQQSMEDVTVGLERIPGVTPEFTSIVATESRKKIGTLLEDIPKPKPNPRGKAYESLSRSQLKLAADMWEATFDPMSIFDDFRDGVVSYDKVQYVWKQNPGLQIAMQAGVQDFLTMQMSDDEKVDIPDSALTQLDFLLGYEGQLQDSLAPGFSLTMSRAGQQQGADEDQQPMVSQKTQTFTQRVASRM
jgi:hypothetical protein